MIKTRPARVLVITALVFILSIPSHSSLTAPIKTFTVNSLADTVDANPGNGKCEDAGGNCTLRAAVMESNTLVGPDSIQLPEDVFPLLIAGAEEDSAEMGDLDLKGSLSIKGAGAGKSIIDAQKFGDRIFDIQPGAIVTISGVTIRNGTIGGGFGGGIKNSGTLLLKESEVEFNSADFGGGIINYHKMTIENSEINDNDAHLNGGGINNNEADLTLYKTAVFKPEKLKS